MIPRPVSAVRSLLRLRRVETAIRLVRETDARTLHDQVELTLIPAPPFGEGPRAAHMAELMTEVGLTGVEIDGVGNVLGRYSGGADLRRPPLVVSAHLDTAFPPGTPITLHREGRRLRAPGITDDGRGLAALLAVARALRGAQVPLQDPVVFAATVGEEGSGDLRGVKHLFRRGGPVTNARGFISLDGAGMEALIVRGVGSRRLRVSLSGPGGHSWADYGTPNPIHILAGVASRLARSPLPSVPRTTLTIARWGGGSGINAIPEEAWLELDLRCEEPGTLGRLEEQVHATFRELVATEVALSQTRGEDAVLTPSIEVIGDRPAGATDPAHPLVQAALAATRSMGGVPVLMGASTDANLPMSLGVPALAMGAGGRAGGAHTLGEWYDNEGGPEGILRALLTVLLAVGVALPAAAPGD